MAHPVLVVGTDGPSRRRAISTLAADRAERGDGILWIGSEHVARPLAWLSALREQRLDARPLRPELGDEPWPGVNPFDLAPGLLAEWLAHETSAGPEQQKRLHALVHAHESDRFSRPARWAALPFPDGVIDLNRRGAALPSSWSGSNPPPGVRRRTTLSYARSDLTVVCGHAQDLVDRRAEILLALLAFATIARRSDVRGHLIVIDGWLDRLHPSELRLALAALSDTAVGSHARVLVGSARVDLWNDPPGAGFAWSAVPVVTSALPSAIEPLAAPAQAVPAVRPFGSRDWTPVDLPSPAPEA